MQIPYGTNFINARLIQPVFSVWRKKISLSLSLSLSLSASAQFLFREEQTRA